MQSAWREPTRSPGHQGTGRLGPPGTARAKTSVNLVRHPNLQARKPAWCELTTRGAMAPRGICWAGRRMQNGCQSPSWTRRTPHPRPPPRCNPGTAVSRRACPDVQDLGPRTKDVPQESHGCFCFHTRPLICIKTHLAALHTTPTTHTLHTTDKTEACKVQYTLSRSARDP